MHSHLQELAEQGRKHVVARLTPEALFLKELKEILPVQGQNWTSPYGRGYLYEFFVQQGQHEISLLIEISAVVRAAAVYYAYREHSLTQELIDDCRDHPRDDIHEPLRTPVVAFLENHSYTILSYETLDLKFGQKSLRELLIYDPED